jgi:hypothetical protein
MRKHDPEEINARTRPESRYETRDVDLGPLTKSFIGFFIGSVVLIVAVVPAYLLFIKDAGGPPSKQDLRVAIPRGQNPVLQTNVTAKMDIVELRRKENAALNSYGWTDKGTRIAHIPIERAIKLTAQKGLNAQGQSQ